MKRPAGNRSPFGDDRGTIVLWSLGLLLLLFFSGGLALDLWRVLSHHGTLTGIADKAAVAGAAEIDVNALYSNRLVLVPGRAVGAAEAFARAQPGWEGGSMTGPGFGRPKGRLGGVDRYRGTHAAQNVRSSPGSPRHGLQPGLADPVRVAGQDPVMPAGAITRKAP